MSPVATLGNVECEHNENMHVSIQLKFSYNGASLHGENFCYFALLYTCGHKITVNLYWHKNMKSLNIKLTA